MSFLTIALVLDILVVANGQETFDASFLRAVQDEITTQTQWRAAPVTPIAGKSPNMVITQWTSKETRDVVIVTLYRLESQKAAQTKLEGLATTFDGKLLAGVGDGAHSWGRGGLAFRRGSVVGTVTAVAFKKTARGKFDRGMEKTLCTRFARAADTAVKVASSKTH